MPQYHVVHIKYHGKHRHYEVWQNNKRCIISRVKLKKHKAYLISNLLNGK